MTRPQAGILVCRSANQVHDSDYVLDRLMLLLESSGVSDTTVLPDYGDTTAIDGASFAVSYIAQRDPAPDETRAMRRLLEQGGRWFAIHTSSAVAEDCDLPSLLGSRFLSHPPYGPFSVAVAEPNDALLDGVGDFEVEDELYVTEHADDIDVLLAARWGGEGLRGRRFDVAVRPLMYRRRVGDGEVLYLALGHCNAAAGDVPERRGGWQSPVFRELVRRGVSWAAGHR